MGSSVSVSLSRADVLELLEVVSVRATAGSGSNVTSSLAGGSGALSGLNSSHWSVDGAAGTATVQLGDVTNAGTDNGLTVEGVEIVLRGVVRNTAAAQGGVGVDATASVSGSDLSGGEAVSRVVTLTVSEGSLAAPGVSPVAFTDTDGGDKLNFTMTVGHAGGSAASVFNVTLLDSTLLDGRYVVSGVWVNGVVQPAWSEGGSRRAGADAASASASGVSADSLAGAVIVWPRLDVGDSLSVVVEVELLPSIDLGGSVNASLSAQWWSHPDVGDSRNASVAAEADVLMQHADPAVQMYARTPDSSLSSSLSPSSVVGGQSVEVVVAAALPAGTARDVVIRVRPGGPDGVLDPASISVVSVSGPSLTKLRVVCGGVLVTPLSLLGSAPHASVNASTGEVVIGPCTMVNNDTLDGVSESIEVVVGGRVLRDAAAGSTSSVIASVSSLDVVPAVTNSSVTLTVAGQGLSRPDVLLPSVLSDVDGGDSMLFSTVLRPIASAGASVFDVVVADSVLANVSLTATGAPVYSVGRVWVNGSLVAGGSASLADAVLVLSEVGAGQVLAVQWEVLVSSDVEAGAVVPCRLS